MQNNKNENNQQQPKTQKARAQIKDFWLHAVVVILVLCFFITIAALCYGIITTPPRKTNEAFQFNFPWVGWFASMLISPAFILAMIYLAFGGDKVTNNKQSEAEWENNLPQRWRRLYRFIKDAPLIIIIMSLLILGATMLTIDGALVVISNIIELLLPYLPYLIGGLLIFGISIASLIAFFRYKNNQLYEEYAFRREVFEKTGVIIIDKKNQALFASKHEEQKQISAANTESLIALAQGETDNTKE